jgi:membrane-bound lytic murein transglycosylase D
MYPFRLITPVLLAALAGCASGEAMVAAAPATPAPEVAAPVDTVPPAPVVEPDAPLEQRWAAPFAVQSVGQLAARDPRPAVVRLETADSAPKPVRPDTVPLNAVPVDTASARPPAPPRPRADSTRTATRPARPASGGAAPSTRSGTPARRSHEVKPGETFYGVARKFDVTPAALRAANPGVDPETLRSGTTLWIPGASAASSSSSTTTRSGESRGSNTAPRNTAAKSDDAPRSGSSSAARAGRRTHTVVRGDTLFGIARKYGVSAAAIRTANKLEDDNVKLGATLVIPAS